MCPVSMRITPPVFRPLTDKALALFFVDTPESNGGTYHYIGTIYSRVQYGDPAFLGSIRQTEIFGLVPEPSYPVEKWLQFL